MPRYTKESGRLAGIRSQQVQAKKRLAGPTRVYPPVRGDLLMTDRVTNELAGTSVEYRIYVGDRLNGIIVESFGQVIPKVKTWTKFYDLRRRRVARRWITG